MCLIRSRAAMLALCILAWSSTQAEIPSASGACVAGTIETTPSSDFTVLDGGQVVRHETTGLEWRRCAEGMSWTGTGCTGTASVMTWYEALQHANTESGWRLPNINELRSIVEECRISPAINQQVLPNTPSSYFWSASPYAGHSILAWGVSFYHGRNYEAFKGDSRRLRLIQLSPPLRKATPHALPEPPA